MRKFCFEKSPPPPPGEYLVYLFDRDVPFFMVSLSPIFLERGIKGSQFFWSQLSKHVKGGNFVRSGYYLVCALEHTFHGFFIESGII